jgi:hypothetical protein
LNLDKSINSISKTLEAIESQGTINKDQIDPDQTARQRYEEYKEHWYFINLAGVCVVLARDIETRQVSKVGRIFTTCIKCCLDIMRRQRI